MFDYTSDPDYGELFQTLDQMGDWQLKPSESRYDIREGNLVWMDSRLNPRVCVPKKYRAAILHEFHDTPLGSHFGTDKTYTTLRACYTWPHMYHGVDQYCEPARSQWHQGPRVPGPNLFFGPFFG